MRNYARDVSHVRVRAQFLESLEPLGSRKYFLNLLDGHPFPRISVRKLTRLIRLNVLYMWITFLQVWQME